MVGSPHDRRMAEPLAVMAVHCVAHRRVAGHVDVDRGLGGEGADVLVGDDAVIHADPARELGASWRSQPDNLDPLPARQQEGQSARGLARGARQDDRARAEHLGVVEEVVDQVGGEEQRPEQHLLILGVRVVDRVGLDTCVPVVGRRKRGSVRRSV